MDLKIGADGDLAIEDGELAFVEGAEAVGQHITFRLRTALGESPYAPLAGTPWLQTILKTGTPLESVRFILERRVAGTPGVTSAEVDPVDLDGETREAVTRGRAETINGPVVFEIPALGVTDGI